MQATVHHWPGGVGPWTGSFPYPSSREVRSDQESVGGQSALHA